MRLSKRARRRLRGLRKLWWIFITGFVQFFASKIAKLTFKILK